MAYVLGDLALVATIVAVGTVWNRTCSARFNAWIDRVTEAHR